MTKKTGKLSNLIPDDRNANKGTQAGAGLLEKSLTRLGAGRSILIDKNDRVIAGNKTLEAAVAKGFNEDIIVVETTGSQIVAVKRVDLDLDSREGREMALLDNQVSKVNLDFDVDVIESLSVDFDIDLPEIGFHGAKRTADENEGGLAARFVIPPFSVLDSRQGYWRTRKEDWRKRIGDFGESRESTLRESASGDDPGYYRQKTAVERHLGRKLTNEEFEAEHYKRSTALPVGVSLFDPVLAEVIVTWFGVTLGHAFDPFAGGAFGYVACSLGMSFTGVELRKEQAKINAERLQREGFPGSYINDDARNIDKYLTRDSQDLLFTCPPYFDLEVYSNDPNDASNQKTYAAFYAIIHEALTKSAVILKENRFAVVVVGDIRDKKRGAYYGFHYDVVNTMRAAGLHFYNECILIEQSSSAAIRAANQMKHRKVVKTHQQVLVFYKGDPRKIKDHFPNIAYSEDELKPFVDEGPLTEDDNTIG